MATELTVQSERAFQKQPHIFLNSKSKAKSKKAGQTRRWYKDVGLGFRTPKNAIEGSYIGMHDSTNPLPHEIYEYLVRTFENGERRRQNSQGGARTRQKSVKLKSCDSKWTCDRDESFELTPAVSNLHNLSPSPPPHFEKRPNIFQDLSVQSEL